MAKKIDYSKIKAMAASILECCGDEEEGENPKIPESKQPPADPKPSDWGEEGNDADHSGGQSPNLDFIGDEEPVKEKKKSKDSSIAMFAANLASKFKK